MKFVILTGMSGAGKSTALKMMEDIGFYCVDNLPIPLLEKFVELSDLQQNAELQKVAVGIDIRSGQALEELRSVLDRIKANGGAYDILFLEKWKLFKGKPTEMQGRKARRGTDIFWQVSFLYAKMSTKTGRDRFSVYR